MPKFIRPSNALVTLVLTVATASSGGCSSRVADSFYVENATLVERNIHGSMRQSGSLERAGSVGKELVLSGHRIIAGEGTVIAYREFDRGHMLLPDQAQFAKLTILVPVSLREKEVVLILGEQKGVIAYWSRGASNYPGKSGCHGYASDGKVRLTQRQDDQLLAEVSLKFNLVSPGGWKKECGPFDFNDQLIIEKRNVQDLTTWEGKLGTHPYDESIRRAN